MPGGSSGEISYPTYMEDTHKQWMRGTPIPDPSATGIALSIAQLVNIAHTDAGNPYFGETAYDPNAVIALVNGSPLDKINDQFDAMSTIVAALNTAGYFSDFPDIDILDDLSTELGNVVTAIDTVLASSTITDLVTAFEDNKKPRFLRDMSTWTAGMADINAVNTSSFVIGMGLRQDEFGRSVDAFEADLKSKLYNTVMSESLSQYMKASVLQLVAKNDLTVNGPAIYGQLAQVKTEVEKLIMVATNDKVQRQVQLDVEEAQWDFETYMYACNVMGSIAGAAAGRKSAITPEQSMIGGALAGGAIGAKYGGVWGALGGAALGTILGYYGSK